MGDEGRALWWKEGRAFFLETREWTIDGAGPLDVSPGGNGGICIRGWDRGGVLVRTEIAAFANTEADACRLASSVRVETAAGRIHATGPDPNSDEGWSVNFELQVPRGATLTLNTENGGISFEGFRGTAQFRARNGGVSLIDVGGDLRGERHRRVRHVWPTTPRSSTTCSIPRAESSWLAARPAWPAPITTASIRSSTTALR